MNKQSNNINHSPNMSIKDYAYVEIKKRIINGILQPNQPIIEEELSRRLEISRTPLREALERLIIENLVVRKKNGRLMIAPISIQEVKEIFIVRSKLEEIAVVEATKVATATHIEHLRELGEKIEKASIQGNLEEILDYGGQFHRYIYELSKNNIVKKFLFQINDHIQRYRRLVPKQSVTRTIEEGKEHLLIVDCMEKKDFEGAERAIKIHILNSLSYAEAAVEEYKRNQQLNW